MEQQEQSKHVLGRLDEVKGLVQQASDHLQQAADHHDSAVKALSGIKPDTAIIDINAVTAKPNDGIGLVGAPLRQVLPDVDSWLTREEGRLRNAENTGWAKIKSLGLKSVEYAIVAAIALVAGAAAYLRLHG